MVGNYLCLLMNQSGAKILKIIWAIILIITAKYQNKKYRRENSSNLTQKIIEASLYLSLASQKVLLLLLSAKRSSKL